MCDQCIAVMINGVHCHEHGCPNANVIKKYGRRKAGTYGRTAKPYQKRVANKASRRHE